MDQQSRFVAHLPDFHLILPALQHEVEIAVVHPFDRHHQHAVAVVAGHLVPLRQIGGESVPSPFEHLLNIGLRIEAADQAENRFNPVLFQHLNGIIERRAAKLPLLRLSRAPVAPDPADRLAGEPHVAEGLLETAGTADGPDPERIGHVEGDAVLRIRPQRPAGRKSRMEYGLVNDNEVAADSLRGAPRKFQLCGKGAAERRIPAHLSFKDPVRLPGERDRE